VGQRHPPQGDSGCFQQRKLSGPGRRPVQAYHRSDAQPQARGGQRAVRHGAAQPPAPRVRGRDVPRRRAHDYHLRRLAEGGVYSARFPHVDLLESNLFFYELREGDEDIFSDLLLAREEEMDPEDFFALVQSIRKRVQDSFEQDTLIEAIAEELERDYDFIAISDDRLSASVNVSLAEDDNFLADLDSEDEPDYQGIFLDFPTDGGRPN
jgi:hypothetical protein